MGSEERIASARRVAALESVQPPSGRRGRATGPTPSNPRGAPSVSAAPRVLAGLMSAPFPWAKRRAFDAARADVARISFRGLRPAGRRRRRVVGERPWPGCGLGLGFGGVPAVRVMGWARGGCAPVVDRTFPKSLSCLASVRDAWQASSCVPAALCSLSWATASPCVANDGRSIRASCHHPIPIRGGGEREGAHFS